MASRKAVFAVVSLTALVAVFWGSHVEAVRGYGGLNDLLAYYYPKYEATARALASGEIPLWNAHQLTGTPWLAALQAGVLYPVHALHLVLPLPLAMSLGSGLHLVLIAVSVLAFVRRAGLGWAPALLAGALCALQGRFVTWVAVPNVLEAAAWMAPGAVAVLGLAQRAGGRSVALLALSLGMSLLAGHPQVTLFAVYGWGVLVVGIAAAERRQPFARVAALFALAIALGSLLAAVQLLPTERLLGSGTRTLEELPLSVLYPFGPPRGIGAAMKGVGARVSWVALALLPFALLGAHRRLAFVVLGMGLLAVGFALGPTTPLFDLYRLLPFLDAFRNPPRILYLLDWSLAICAAIGWVGLQGRLRRFGAPVVLGVTALVFGLVLVESFARPRLRVRLPYTIEGPMKTYHEVHEAWAPAVAASERILFWSPGVPTLPPQLATLHDMRSVSDYEPLNLARQAEYWSYLGHGTHRPPGVPYFGRLDLPRGKQQVPGFARRARLLDLAAVRWVLAPKSLLGSANWERYAAAAGLFELETSDGALTLFENPDAMQRAYVAVRVERAPPIEELMPLLARPSFDPRRLSYVESTRRLPHSGVPLSESPSVRIATDEPERVVLEVALEAAGLVVLADSFYSGWKVTVDGEPADIVPTNHLFRGVFVDAGNHVVVFTLRADRYWSGAALSLLALVALAAIARWLPDRRGVRHQR